MVDFVITDDSVSMESHVFMEKDKRNKKIKTSKVKSISVSKFVADYNVPKYFAVLSIDAEGQGNKVRACN